MLKLKEAPSSIRNSALASVDLRNCETLQLPPLHGDQTDVPFTSFCVGGSSYRFADLPQTVQGSHMEVDCLYWGRPIRIKNPHDAAEVRRLAEQDAKIRFCYGRKTRGSEPHYDVLRHLESTRRSGIPSGFFQTTRSFAVALDYGLRNSPYCIVYLIATKGADLLDVNALATHLNDTRFAPYSDDEEVLFFKTIPAARFQSAILAEKLDQDHYKITARLINPNCALEIPQ